MPLFQLSPSGNPTNPGDYSPTSSPSCPTGTSEICTITANDDGSGKPVITVPLLQAMVIALHTDTPNIPTIYLRG